MCGGDISQLHMWIFPQKWKLKVLLQNTKVSFEVFPLKCSCICTKCLQDLIRPNKTCFKVYQHHMASILTMNMLYDLMLHSTYHCTGQNMHCNHSWSASMFGCSFMTSMKGGHGLHACVGKHQPYWWHIHNCETRTLFPSPLHNHSFG